MASLQSRVLNFWIRRVNPFSRKDYQPVQLRERVERLARRAVPRPGVKVIPVNAGGVPAEWLIPRVWRSGAVLFYLHGGAWFMGSVQTHRFLVSELAHAGGVRALSLNYRLAPEHPFPAGLEDCLAAYHWLLENGVAPQQVVLAGDSAGGNLALAMMLHLRDEDGPLPAGMVGLSPATDLTWGGASHRTRAHMDPYFGRMGVNSIVPDYAGGTDLRYPLISPLFGDLAGLPPLLLHVGDYETLLDDVVRFGERAVAAGVEAQTVVWPGMFHVFQIFTPLLPEARQSVEQIAAFIKERLAASSEVQNQNLSGAGQEQR